MIGLYEGEGSHHTLEHNSEPLEEEKLETKEPIPRKKQKLVAGKFTPFSPFAVYEILLKINRKLRRKNIWLKNKSRVCQNPTMEWTIVIIF